MQDLPESDVVDFITTHTVLTHRPKCDSGQGLGEAESGDICLYLVYLILQRNDLRTNSACSEIKSEHKV